MQKSKRADDDDMRSEEGGAPLRSQGAPRGLLHFYALLSIARRPMRGYDLIREIEFKTEGAWRPGPGAVYPVLQKLAKEGYISGRKKTGDGPTQVLYEITPAGVRRIAGAKKMMLSSTERLGLMSSLFVDLMDPDDLVRFVLSSLEAHIQFVHTVVESDKTGVSDEDKLFILRQYRLNLERELARAESSIEEMDGGRRPQKRRE